MLFRSRLAGQSFGNLFLAALNGMCASFDEAVRRMSEVLAITGRVLPVTNENAQLLAEFTDGAIVRGESYIAKYDGDGDRCVKRVFLEPNRITALPESLAAIERADMIVIGPGSLYTSIIPNLLTGGVSKAIVESDALKVFVMNIMTQSGETEGLTASDHVRAIFDHAGAKIFDFCLANSAELPAEVLELYAAGGGAPTIMDYNTLTDYNIEVISRPVADLDCGLARHSPAALAAALMDLFREKAETRIYS